MCIIFIQPILYVILKNIIYIFNLIQSKSLFKILFSFNLPSTFIFSNHLSFCNTLFLLYKAMKVALKHQKKAFIKTLPTKALIKTLPTKAFIKTLPTKALIKTLPTKVFIKTLPTKAILLIRSYFRCID